MVNFPLSNTSCKMSHLLVVFKFVMLLIFCPPLSVHFFFVHSERVLNSPAIAIDLLFILLCFSLGYFFLYLGAYTFRRLILVLSSWWMDPFSSDLPYSDVYFVWYYYGHFSFFFFNFCFRGLSLLIFLLLTLLYLYFWWLILCVNLTEPHSAQVFGWMLVWVCL